MTTHTSKVSNLLSTADPAAELQWSNLLDLQIAQFFPYELQYFFANEPWMTSKRVLDAGCGSGRYLAALKRFFPDKSYVGLDVSNELVAVARQDPDLRNVELVCGDFFAFEPAAQFDIIVMRLIVQHMKGLKPLFDKIERLLAETGRLLIIEPAPELFRNVPPTPIFQKLLVDYAAQTARRDLNRSHIGTLAEALSSMPAWRVTNKAQFNAPLLGPFKATALMQIFGLWIDIFERSGAVSYDFAAARRELDEWAELPTSYNQVGLNIIEIGRAG